MVYLPPMSFAIPWQMWDPWLTLEHLGLGLKSMFNLVLFWFFPFEWVILLGNSNIRVTFIYAGSKVSCIGYSYWYVAIIICWEAVATGWSLVPVLAGNIINFFWYTFLTFFYFFGRSKISSNTRSFYFNWKFWYYLGSA